MRTLFLKDIKVLEFLILDGNEFHTLDPEHDMLDSNKSILGFGVIKFIERLLLHLLKRL